MLWLSNEKPKQPSKMKIGQKLNFDLNFNFPYYSTYKNDELGCVADVSALFVFSHIYSPNTPWWTHTHHVGKAGSSLFTHCESTLDIPRMSEDCQIYPDDIEAFPLWDQAWMRACCRGSKAKGWGGGGGIQASNWPAECGCQSERTKTLPEGFERIKKAILPSLERGCRRQVWDKKEKCETVHKQV